MGERFKEYCGKLLQFIKKEWKNVVLSVAISIVVWFAISIQIFPNITTHVDNIEVHVIPTSYMTEENLQLAEDYNESVSIQIQGKRYDIGNLSADNFYAYLDLSRVSEAGEHVVNIVVEPVDEKNDFEILTKNLTATIKVKKIITREIEVTPVADNITLQDGFQIEEEDLTANPSTITVTGEESLVNSIDRVEAKAVYDGIMQTTSEVKGELYVYNKSNSRVENPDLTYDNTNFTVNVPVYKVKTLPLAVSFTNVPSNFYLDSLSYTITPSEITIASPDNSVDNLDKIDIGEISLNDLTFKDLQGGVALTITLPQGYKNISQNKAATVTFNDTDSYGKLEFTVTNENINVINAPSNFDITVLTRQLDVSVIGPSKLIQELTGSNIYVTANLLGVEIGEGTKSVPVTFRIAGYNVRSWVIGEYKIDISATLKTEETE